MVGTEAALQLDPVQTCAETFERAGVLLCSDTL